MAVPSYTEDLTDITLSEATTGFSALGGGGAGLGTGADFAMQGTLCVDKQITNTEKGMVYDNGATITNSTDRHFFIWVFLATPGLANSLLNRGLAIVAGTSTSAYNKFHVEGNDTYGAVGRVGKCYPIRYNTTANPSIPYRTLTGSPGANPQYFGATANTTASVKAANLGVDAMRYGTGAYITAGDSSTPATFDGFSTDNDAITNRWGILTKVGGGYELQGRFVVGQNNSQVATLAYFDDSNKVISLVNTPHSATDFTQFIIDHSSTVFNLTNVTVLALGTNNPGRLVFNNTSTDATLISCTFDGLGVSTLRAGVTADKCIWRGADTITQNGATISNSTIATGSTSVELLSDNPTLISNTVFAVPSIINTVYFDGSDVIATDDGANWTGETNADDGLLTTEATTTSTNSSTLSIEGTNYIGGNTGIMSVKCRVFGDSINSSNNYDVRFYEDGGTILLGTINISTEDGTSVWSNYISLSEHTGGWTGDKIRALELQIATNSTGFAYFSKAELEIETEGGHGIEIDTPGTYTFTGNSFSGFAGTDGSTGNEAIYNNSGGAVTLNIEGGGDTPTIRNGTSATTTVNNTVTISVGGVSTGSEPTNYVRCHIEKVSDQTVLLNAIANTADGSDYKATASYDYAGDVDVIVRARYKGYLPFESTGTITSAGLSVNAVWVADPNFT